MKAAPTLTQIEHLVAAGESGEIQKARETRCGFLKQICRQEGVPVLDAAHGLRTLP